MSGIGMMMLGTGGDRVSLPTYGENYFTSSGAGPQQSTYRLTSGGVIETQRTPTGTTVQGSWVTPTSSAANYEVLATLTSGTVTGSATGSWLALNTTRSWSVLQGIIGTNSASLALSIRRIGTTTVLASTAITLEAERFS